MAVAQNAEGVILRKYPLRETSYILVVYTREFGKIKGVIKGMRNPSPQFAGNLEPFSRCKLLFYRKKKKPLDLITQCEAEDTFLPLRKEIERLTYANYFIELIDVVTGDHDANEELYRLLVESLRMLGSGASPRRIGRIFELKLLGGIGLSPLLDGCASCGAKVSEKAVFSVKSGGVLCPKCRRGGSSRDVSMGTVKFLRKIQTTELGKTLHVKVSRDVGKETEIILRDFMRYHINRPIRSMKFLEQMQRAGIIRM